MLTQDVFVELRWVVVSCQQGIGAETPKHTEGYLLLSVNSVEGTSVEQTVDKNNAVYHGSEWEQTLSIHRTNSVPYQLDDT